MKRLLAPLFLVALLTGCATVAHDGYGHHRSTTVVSGHISSGYYAPAPIYVTPAPVYVRPAPVYVRPAPVYVQPAPVIGFKPHRHHAPAAQPPAYRHGEHRAGRNRTDDERQGRRETRDGRQAREEDGHGRFRTR